MADRCPTDVYYEFHGMEQRNYNPIEIARQYAPKFDKPVVDMVEVVRCKDCKHFAKWGKNVAPDTGYYCTRPNQQSCNLVPEDYCSYAERKEVKND